MFYRRLAVIAGEYLKKGSQIYIEGKLQTRKWQTKEGQDRYTTEVIVNEMTMLGGKSSGSDTPNNAGVSKPDRTVANDAAKSFDEFDSDGIPF